QSDVFLLAAIQRYNSRSLTNRFSAFALAIAAKIEVCIEGASRLVLRSILSWRSHPPPIPQNR
ncbi:MAG TPA: hypothetical protein DCZ55_27270, partial [Cyanobacteria bacterium UBA11371]|nr:hypothetical protein [Cyanobacteria bacterium UBA11371]